MVIDGDGFDASAEDGVILLKPIEGRVQVCNNCLGFIGEDDEFQIDFLVSHFGCTQVRFYTSLCGVRGWKAQFYRLFLCAARGGIESLRPPTYMIVSLMSI
jgi:hypothetical protein